MSEKGWVKNRAWRVLKLSIGEVALDGFKGDLARGEYAHDLVSRYFHDHPEQHDSFFSKVGTLQYYEVLKMAEKEYLGGKRVIEDLKVAEIPKEYPTYRVTDGLEVLR